MHFLNLILMLLQVGCATKYILAGNRFITPETHGGNLRSQVEIQSGGANQLTVNTEDGGANTVATNRTGYLFETSLFESLDFYWTHTGGGNSLLGGKFQIMGPSRAGGVGHKVALAAGFGGNEHEIDGDPEIQFELTAQEFMALYGFRLNEMFLFYSSVSHTKYNFSGEITSSDSAINGLRPDLTTKVLGGFLGTEVRFMSLVGKIEFGYQQLQTTSSKDFTNMFWGWSMGYHW